MIETTSVQDRDLLGRLSIYFNNIELRVREGQGWLIFNADRKRAGRIATFIDDRLREYRPLLSSYLLPWRDFALNAYMLKIELSSDNDRNKVSELSGRLLEEYTIAGRVSKDMYYHMRFCDLLVLTGVAPTHAHELRHLDDVVDYRIQQRRPMIIISPKMPDQLAEEFHSILPTTDERDDPWKRFFWRLYQSNLIAM